MTVPVVPGARSPASPPGVTPGPGGREVTLGWRMLDATVAVRTDAAGLAARLRDWCGALAPATPARTGEETGDGTGRRTGDGAGPTATFVVARRGRRRERWAVHGPAGRVVTTAHPGVGTDLLLWSMHQVALARATGPLVLHAAAVQARSGAVVCCGPSGAGKSTLAAALTRAGYGYLTDETVTFDTAGRVRPYPKWVGLDDRAVALVGLPVPAPGRWDPPGLRPVPPAALGRCGTATRPGLLVVPRIEPGARSRLEPLRPAEVALELGAQAWGLDRPGAAEVLAALVATVPGWRLVVGDLPGAVAACRSLAGEPPR